MCSSIIGEYTTLENCMQRNSHICNKFKGAISEYKGVLYCGAYDCHELPNVIMGQPCSIQFSQEVE